MRSRGVGARDLEVDGGKVVALADKRCLSPTLSRLPVVRACVRACVRVVSCARVRVHMRVRTHIWSGVESLDNKKGTSVRTTPADGRCEQHEVG